MSQISLLMSFLLVLSLVPSASSPGRQNRAGAVTVYDDLAARLAGATSDADRAQLRESNKNLLTAELRAALEREGRRLLDSRDTVHAMTAFQIERELAET